MYQRRRCEHSLPHSKQQQSRAITAKYKEQARLRVELTKRRLLPTSVDSSGNASAQGREFSQLNPPSRVGLVSSARVSASSGNPPSRVGLVSSARVSAPSENPPSRVGLQQPTLESGEPVRGATKRRHTLENKSRRKAKQVEWLAAPTKCSQLVASWPDYVGVMDASGHGVGLVITGAKKACPPTVARFPMAC